jgi:hypothetical protein
MSSQNIRVLARTPAADLWRRTLSQIPGVFGRLVYLASLRNSNTGLYEHHGLASAFGEEEADRTLRASHERTFAEWLSFNLENQKLDLDVYLSGLSTDRKTIVKTWLRLAPYRNFIPAAAGAAERALYLSDLAALLDVLRVENGVSAFDRGSWQLW